MTVFYEIAFVLSLILTLIYAAMWHKHFNVFFTLIFAFIPLTNLGYMLVVNAEDLESAFMANSIVYFGSCFLIMFVTLSIFGICRLKLGKPAVLSMMLVSTVVSASSLTAGKLPIFYKTAELTHINGIAVLTGKSYGFMHTVFYIMLIGYFTLSLAALVYCFLRKRSVSHRILLLMFIPVALCIATYFGRKFISADIEIIPVAYIIAQVVYLFIIDRMCLYDINDTVIDSLVQTGDTGIVSIDLGLNFLGSNTTARNIFPKLRELTVDRPAGEDLGMTENAGEWLRSFREDESNDKFYYKSGDRTYLVDINYLYDGKRKRGYRFIITDDTANQQYISLINSYNTDLKEQVEEKTAHIEEMHDKLILGMAVMVESRDNSTGGHIRRTSDCIRILIDKIKQTGVYELDDDFCKRLIKAAPMHDLGKIAVDDAVLRKPGRFTDEEFEKMKAHAAEGARIVHSILDGTDDVQFHIIAENVAHYHHERWDGSGYPKKLKGEEIPLEARIMAIVDVYDALVSKRCYKDSMPFDKAFAIIDEGMGTQFDPELRESFVLARAELEAYYS